MTYLLNITGWSIVVALVVFAGCSTHNGYRSTRTVEKVAHRIIASFVAAVATFLILL